MDQNIFAHNLTFCVIHVTRSMMISFFNFFLYSNLVPLDFTVHLMTAEALLKVGLRLQNSLLLAHLHTFYELSRSNLSERDSYSDNYSYPG